MRREKHSRKDRRRESRDAKRAARQAHEQLVIRRSRIVRLAFAAAVAASGIVGFLASAGSFLPRIAVEPQFTWDRRAPLTTQFRVQNSGLVPLRDVRRDCVFVSFNGGAIKSGKNEERGGFNNLESISSLSPIATELPVDGAITTNCNFIGTTREDRSGVYEATEPDRVDVALVFRYHSFLWPWPRRQAFRFVTSIDREGNVQWLRKPITAEIEERIDRLADAPLIGIPPGWRFAVTKPNAEKPPTASD